MSLPFARPIVNEGRAFSVNVLKKGQLELAAHYGGPAGPDKLVLMEGMTARTDEA
jgi:hypothetical protein